MVKIKKIGPIALREYIKEKKIIVFGAGRALNSALDNYFETKDLEFIIPTFQDVVVVEYKKGLRECKSFPVTEWYKINGLNREVISIMPDDWMLYIEVYE